MSKDVLEGQRLDKWLWVARFFKTRGLAAEAISGGKVHLDGQRVKPAKLIRPSARLEIRRGDLVWDVVVQALSAQRLSAPLAQALYEETEQSVNRRSETVALRRAFHRSVPIHEGRPTKRDRRKLEEIKPR
ncbi:MAG: S4 domain-containing protein [Pseudomonadota bacterium]